MVSQELSICKIFGGTARGLRKRAMVIWGTKGLFSFMKPSRSQAFSRVLAKEHSVRADKESVPTHNTRALEGEGNTPMFSSTTVMGEKLPLSVLKRPLISTNRSKGKEGKNFKVKCICSGRIQRAPSSACMRDSMRFFRYCLASAGMSKATKLLISRRLFFRSSTRSLSPPHSYGFIFFPTKKNVWTSTQGKEQYA